MTAIVREALEAADGALRDHACHAGPDQPCRRAAYQCQLECGKSAGDALILVTAALAALDATPGEGERQMRAALRKATVISAYNISDPLAVRVAFTTDEDRVAFADAIDGALSGSEVK